MATLASTMADDRVPFDELHNRYRPVLEMVRTLIGVVPNCDPYLEIWQPGFRTYNLIVPNFLNLPHSLAGRGAPKDLVGLGMYLSSRAAGCAYCSAHTCSFALRRGSSGDAVTGESRSPVEAAVAAMAEGLSTVPATYDPSMEEELLRHLSADDADWVVMGVAMMGFLNKFMDALGVELEQEAVDDVADLIQPTGWSVGQHEWAAQEGLQPRANGDRPPVDSLSTAWPVLRNAVGAIRLDRKWMAGVPKDGTEARRQLAAVGFDEPLVEGLRHQRPRRALAAVLHHNLDGDQSAVGLGLKALAGVVFAKRIGSDHLLERARAMAERHGVAPAMVSAAEAYDPTRPPSPVVDEVTSAVLRVAYAFGPSPAEVDGETIEAASVLTSAQIVELAVWVSVNQLIHRLTVRRLATA